MVKNRLINRLVLVGICTCGWAEEMAEGQQIGRLSTVLQQGKVLGLASAIREMRLQAPRIPSRWSVEHRTSLADDRKVDVAAREFGRELAVQLDATAPLLQTLALDVELKQQARALCDLSDWCAATTGYGNLLLAQRCLDLAAVGLARLTASLDYPIGDCRELAARMTPGWMAVAVRARALNDEAGTNLFAVGGTQEEMERTWGSGGFLVREKRGGKSRPQGQAPGRGFVDTQEIRANLDFFERDEPTAAPVTLTRTWDSRRYERIVNGLELQSARKALALLRFRSTVGTFPEMLEISQEESQQRERLIADHATIGVKIVKCEDAYRSPGEAAFAQAWERRPERNAQDHALYASAWLAYSQVKNGQFVDQDTCEERKAARLETRDPSCR